MRYSEGAKRYYDDTKKRIFDEIIAAAEAEKTAVISQAENVSTIIEDQKKEGITMKNTTMENTNEKVKIRSSRGGLIAAACAVLVVGGGLFAAGHMNGGVSVQPGTAGTSFTTDAEDSIDGEEETNDVSDEVLDIENGEWWEGVDPVFAGMIDNADFVGEVVVVNSQRETIDGVDYIDYFCALTDDNGNSGTIFKYMGDEAIPNRFSIMQRAEDGVDVLDNGDKMLVIAKQGVQSESGGFSFELTDASALFKFDNTLRKACCYRNLSAPGDYSEFDEDGKGYDYHFGLYEEDMENYYRYILGNAIGDDVGIAPIVSWCEFNDVEYREYTVDGLEPGEIRVTWYYGDLVIMDLDFDGVVFEFGSGEAKDKDKTDSETETEEESVIVDSASATIVEFPGYNVELVGVVYDSRNNLDAEDGDFYDNSGAQVGVIIGISKADGTAFPADYLDNNSLEIIYGDLEPFMSALQAEELSIGISWLSEDNSRVNVAMYTAGDIDLAAADGAEVTVEVNTIVENGVAVAEGLFKADFEISEHLLI